MSSFVSRKVVVVVGKIVFANEKGDSLSVSLGTHTCGLSSFPRIHTYIHTYTHTHIHSNTRTHVVDPLESTINLSNITIMPFFSELHKTDGTPVKDIDAALAGKVVALYFSSNWCGACKKFTPLLSVLYEQVKEEAGGDVDMEIIFVSSDDNKDDCTEYVTKHHGKWLMIPYDSAQRQELKQTFGVFAGKEQSDFGDDTKRKSGIPTLVVVSSDGTELDLLDCDSEEVHKEVETKQAAFLERWKDHVWKAVEPPTKKAKQEDDDEAEKTEEKKEEETEEKVEDKKEAEGDKKEEEEDKKEE